MTQRKFTKDEITDMDFAAYLASSESSESEDEGDENVSKDPESRKAETKEKYKNLVNALKGEEDINQEMEVTFTPGLSTKLENLIQQKLVGGGSGEQTPFEKLIEKRTENRRERKRQFKEKKDQNDGKDSEYDENSDEDFERKKRNNTKRKTKEKPQTN